MLSARSNLDILVKLEGDDPGVKFDANAGAYVAEGELTYGGYILGTKYTYDVGGSYASLHAGASYGITYDSKTGITTVTGLTHAGAGLGVKGGVVVEFPNYIKLIKDFFQ